MKAKTEKVACRILLLCFLGTIQILAQPANDEIKIEISAETLELNKGAIIKLVFQTPRNKFKALKYQGGFRLSKSPELHTTCAINQCFSTVRIKELDKKLAHGKLVNTSINLSNLYWLNGIRAGIDTSFPANLFTDVPTGEYYLNFILREQFEGTDEKQLHKEIISNQLRVTIVSSTR